MSLSAPEVVAIARLLRIALGYESREVRIGMIKASKFLDVRGLAMRLEAAGHLKENSVDDNVSVEDFHP